MSERNESAKCLAVEKIISAAKPWFKGQREALLDAILENSNKRLAPLCDPLTVNLGTHRWLRDEREKAYSDWFAWVNEQLPSSPTDSRVLGITPPTDTKDTYHNCPEAKREELILGNKRRLNVRICFGTTALIVVELKNRFRCADVEKNRDYTILVAGCDTFQAKESRSLL
jgi:hypothetical protein